MTIMLTTPKSMTKIATTMMTKTTMITAVTITVMMTITVMTK